MNTKQLLSDDTKSVRDTLMLQNSKDRDLLSSFVDRKISKIEFKKQASERYQGQWQWSMCSHNIRGSGVLCKNACSYCYIGPMFKRFGRKCRVPDFEELMPVDEKKVKSVAPYSKPVKSPADRKMVFFPSSSDIFVENAADYVSAAKKIMDSGHEIMWVTKAPPGAVEAVVNKLEELPNANRYKCAMNVFVTITTNDQAIHNMFEPRTTSFAHRIETIRFLVSRDFEFVNVMFEPYLSDPVPLIPSIMDVLPPKGMIAIGRMNYSASIVFSEDPSVDAACKHHLEALYTKDNTMNLYHSVRNNPRIFLKKETTKDVLKWSG